MKGVNGKKGGNRGDGWRQLHQLTEQKRPECDVILRVRQKIRNVWQAVE